MSKLGEILKKFLPNSSMSTEKKILVSAIFGIVIFMLLCVVIGIVVFATTMKGQLVVSVPNLYGLELAEAMGELQNYGLVAEVHQRVSKAGLQKGVVFAQHPRCGSNIKMGGKVILSVSRGNSDIELEDYCGQNIAHVKQAIADLNFKAGADILTINEALIYKADVASGVILAQNPEPRTRIHKPTTIDFQISAGKWEPNKTLPNLVGLNIANVLKTVSENDIPFHFVLANSTSQNSSVVVAQTPKANEILPLGEVVELSISKLNAKRGMSFGIFSHELPKYELPMQISVYTKEPKGRETLYFSCKHIGGEITIPYYATEQTSFILKVEDNEVAQFLVQ